MSLVTRLRTRIEPHIPPSLRNFILLHHLPQPPGHPVLGHLREVSSQQSEKILEAWADRYGAVFRVRLMHSTAVVVSDPELVGEALRRRPRHFRRISSFERVFSELGFNGLFTTEGDDWRRQRRLVMSAFGRSKLRDMRTMVERITERLLERWNINPGVPRDVLSDLTCFTADVTMLVAFGYDLDSLRVSSKLQQQITTIFEGLARRFIAVVPTWKLIKRPNDIALEQAIAALRETVLLVLRDPRSEGSEGIDNLLRRMQKARLEDGTRRGLSEQELFANVVTIIFAGEDTTSSTLAWMIHYIAHDPVVQERMRQEVEAAFNAQTQTVEEGGLQDLAVLPYINAAFLEALRLQPVAPHIFLEANEDQTLGTLQIPAHTPLIMLTGYCGRATQHFEQPERFMPERWLDKNFDLSRPTRVLYPFGGGPRLCPGRALAQLEVQVLLSSLLRRFEVIPASGARLPQRVMHFTWGPDRVEVCLRRRVES